MDHELETTLAIVAYPFLPRKAINFLQLFAL